jgi:electron transfer flavoprotein alpha subunit
VAGANDHPASEALAKPASVEKVLLAEAPAYEHRLAEPLAALIASLAGPCWAIFHPCDEAAALAWQ